jgi:hypothetical protein
MANDRAIAQHFFVGVQRPARDFVTKVDGFCERHDRPFNFDALTRRETRAGNQAIVLRALKNEPGVGGLMRGLLHGNFLGFDRGLYQYRGFASVQSFISERIIHIRTSRSQAKYIPERSVFSLSILFYAT